MCRCPCAQSSSGCGGLQPALVSNFSVRYSDPNTDASGANASTRCVCDNMQLMCALDIRIFSELSMPPSTASDAQTMPRVPSSKVSNIEPQFSTSFQPVPIQCCCSAW